MQICFRNPLSMAILYHNKKSTLRSIALQRGQATHWSKGTSSPPMCTHREGKSSASSSRIPSKNGTQRSFPMQKISLCTPHRGPGTRESRPVHVRLGKAERAASECPGNSISGITCNSQAPDHYISVLTLNCNSARHFHSSAFKGKSTAMA